MGDITGIDSTSCLAGGAEDSSGPSRNSRLESPRLAIIGSKGLHSEYGGVEKIVHQLCRELRRDFRITVFGSESYKDDQALELTGVSTRYLRLPKVKLTGAGVLSFLSTILAVRDGFGLFYFHACGPGFFSFIPRLFGRKVAWHFHGADYRRSLAALGRSGTAAGLPGQWIRYLFLRSGEAIAVRAAQRIFILGRSNLATLSRRYPRCTSKFVLVSNFPELDPTDDPAILQELAVESESYLLSIARLVPEKHHDLLLEAFLQIAGRFPDLKLLIVGEGEELGRLRLLARGNERIILPGAIPHRRITTLYRQARAFCLCSSVEGQPLSLLEAMACGCPVIASDIPEVAELDQGYLYLFRSGDRGSLVDTLLALLSDRVESRRRAERASQVVNERFSRSAVAGIIGTELGRLIA